MISSNSFELEVRLCSGATYSLANKGILYLPCMTCPLQ